MSEVSPVGFLTVSSDSVCDRGLVREENQDNVRTASLPLGELFIVADGIGGYQGGATASQMVVDGFHSQIAIKQAGYNPDDALREACTYTNHSIHTAASSGDPAKQRMGSTVVLALVQTSGPAGPMAFVGHVGDSRAYLIRNGRMQKITSDHSAVQALLSRNLITEEEARNHPDSSVLTRSLGHRTEVEIEIDHVPLLPGDALLLCSDGLWGYVDEALMQGVVADPTLSLKTVTDALLRLALDAGGQDNIGIQYIRLSGTNPSLTGPLPATFPGTKSPAVYAEPLRAHRGRKLQIAAISLLLLGGIGGLGIAAYNKGLLPFHKLAVLPHKITLVGKPVTKPADATKSPSSDPAGTLLFDNLGSEKIQDCNQRDPNRTVILFNAANLDRAAVENAIARHFPNDHRLQKGQMEMRSVSDDVKQACGGKELEVVVLLPGLGDKPHDVVPANPNGQPASAPIKPHTTPQVPPAQARPAPPGGSGTTPGGATTAPPPH